jgi:rubrerythrin
MLNKIIKSLNEQMTAGLSKAVQKVVANGDVKHKCGNCGFAIPPYPGRYPKNCPECGNEFGARDKYRMHG